MLQTPAIVYCAIDTLISERGKIQAGFEDFNAELAQRNIPIVWVTNRTRLQIDAARRKLGQTDPFIAEGGCAVYLPEGYFNVRPNKTLRQGRFTAIPVAEPQPAAAEALEKLSADSGVEVVPLRSLSPRELAQNSGLPAKEAELARQRDFDELFFFAGAADKDVERFEAEARDRKLQLRRRDSLWSLAVGADLKACVRELSKLYDRVLRSHPTSFGIATSEDDEHGELLAACDRGVLLAGPSRDEKASSAQSQKIKQVPLETEELWEQLVGTITRRG